MRQLSLAAFVLLFACSSSADDPRGDSADESGTALSLEELIKDLYNVSDPSRTQAALWYLGKSGEDDCAVSSVLFDETSYRLGIDLVADVEDPDGLAAVDIRDGDTITTAKTATGVVYDVVDEVCFGTSHVEAQFAGADANIRKLTSVKTLVAETGCQEDGEVTEHPRECTDLVLTFTATNDNLKAAAKLMKQVSEAPTRIVPSRFTGCTLDLGRDSNLVCAWDISDDLEGDTGDIEAGIFELANGVPSKVVGTFLIDKFTGGIRE